MNKKVIFAGLLALTTIFAPAAFAQQADQNTCNAASKECKVAGKERKGECANPFEGIALTAEQKTKLEALKAEKATAREARKAEQAVKKEARRESAKAERSQELAKIKEILTPEQYVQFLENSYLSHRGNGMPRVEQKGRKLEGRKHMKAGNGDFKPGKAPKAEKKSE